MMNGVFFETSNLLANKLKCLVLLFALSFSLNLKAQPRADIQTHTFNALGVKFSLKEQSFKSGQTLVFVPHSNLKTNQKTVKSFFSTNGGRLLTLDKTADNLTVLTFGKKGHVSFDATKIFSLQGRQQTVSTQGMLQEKAIQVVDTLQRRLIDWLLTRSQEPWIVVHSIPKNDFDNLLKTRLINAHPDSVVNLTPYKKWQSFLTVNSDEAFQYFRLKNVPCVRLQPLAPNPQGYLIGYAQAHGIGCVEVIAAEGKWRDQENLLTHVYEYINSLK